MSSITSLTWRGSMPPVSFDTKALIRTLVGWMRNEGVAPTRTRLVKFLYLADLQYARYHGGNTLTGWRWYAYSFGPFAVEALRELDRSVEEHWLVSTMLRQTEDLPFLAPERATIGFPEEQEEHHLSSKVFGKAGAVRFLVAPEPTTTIYRLLDPDFSLEEESLPLGLAKLKSWIREYGSDTKALLRFVYGNTEPMEVAYEGQELDFTLAQPEVRAKLLESSGLKKAEKAKIANLLKSMREKYDSAMTQNSMLIQGPYDEAYFQGLPSDNEEFTGTAILRFSKEK
jgi:hypothetical protein